MAANIFLTLPNGSKMPALGLGTFLAKNEQELENALIVAIEAGYRHIDAAHIYGNEKIIGQTLKKLFDSGKISREDIFITTKLPPQGIFPDKVEFYIKESLENLQLDYVDLYLIHSPIACTKLDDSGTELAQKTDHLGVWKKMEEQVTAGRTKSIGLSNFNISQIENILKHATIKPANLQIEVQLYFQQCEMIEFCQKQGITIVAFGPLGSPGYSEILRQRGVEFATIPDMIKNPVVLKIAEKYSKTPAQILLRHLLQLGVAPIPKSVTPSRIRENINVFDFKLNQNDMKQLAELNAKDEQQLENALVEAIDAGYRHIDTAYAYGNEKVIGRTLKKLFDSGKIKRDDIFITTKLPPQGVFPEKVEAYIKESLASLQLEYVDLYLVHTPLACIKFGEEGTELAPKTDHIGVWKKMEEQVKAGRAKSIGLSNFSISQIENVLKHATIRPANLQIEMQLYFQQRQMLEFCKKEGITVVAYSPLGSPGYNDFLKKIGTNTIVLPDIIKHPVVLKIAEKYSKTTSQVLLRHLLQLGVAPIPKSVTPSRIRENINVFDYQLDQTDMDQLNALDLGPEGRIFTMQRFPGATEHPDYPY